MAAMTPSPLRPGPLQRRDILCLALASMARGTAPAASPPDLAFPRDFGAHTDFRTEWWYITGYANVAGQDAAFGFQITFFRSRVDATQTLRSGLAARHLLFAHAAVTDVAAKTLLHDQRLARWSGAAPGLNPTDSAAASSADTAVTLRDWSLQRQDGVLRAHAAAGDFALYLRLAPSQPVLLQGDRGLSRKGPNPAQSSYYYSQPQLRASGSLVVKGRRHALTAGSSAWLDHEWSQSLLDPSAVGWDWIGINFFNGSALTAFRLRDKQGEAVWDGGSWRAGDRLQGFQRGEVMFHALRHWRSALSQARYPVEWTVGTPAGVFTIRAVVDNQELDSRHSTGSIYWEGLCEVSDGQKLIGRGYLEMTGYAAPLEL